MQKIIGQTKFEYTKSYLWGGFNLYQNEKGTFYAELFKILKKHRSYNYFAMISDPKNCGRYCG
jgi:hypothetical protein